MSVPYHLIDAFTTERFAGNPAAVVHFEPTDPRAHDSQLMLRIAREFNLSETAFLYPLATAEDAPTEPRFSLRWFTPSVEFPLCGHATLASAFSLFTTRHPDLRRIRFETMSGTLHAERLGDGRVELDFPVDEEVLGPSDEQEVERVRSLIKQANADLAEAVTSVRLGRLGVVVELDAAFDLRGAALNAKCLVSRCCCRHHKLLHRAAS